MQLPPTNNPMMPETPRQSGYPTRDEKYIPRKRRRGRFMRFVRGYLMLVGGISTLYVLVQLLVRLFIEVGKWSSAVPIG